MKKFFAVLQQIGQSLMLPVALLPAAGILLALGTAFQNPALLQYLPFLGAHWFQALSNYMSQAGSIVFANLPVLFCVGVAVGISGGEGVAALAALVGFLIMNVVVGIASHVPDIGTLIKPGADQAFSLVLGIPTLQMGVFGGIIMGVIGAKLFKKYYDIELPSYLGFFAGKRFVPIITAVWAIIIGLILSVVWPPIGHAINWFSHTMVDSNLTVSAFVFGVIERALIPFGLHHIWYNPFWYQFGTYVSANGMQVHGDQLMFFAQLKDGVPFTAGTFMTGKFPFMMFGLPAACYAMYKEAAPEKKAIVGALMFSAALTSFLTGITEPVEFSFVFVAPLLFAIHCIFAGLSFAIMHVLGVHIGMTFSGGLIDFLLFGVLPGRTPWWWAIVVGVVIFMPLYYFGFRWAIRKFNIPTPGREQTSDVEEDLEEHQADPEGYHHAAKVVAAFGGFDNIKSLNACITRLRIEVLDSSKVNKPQLKQLGAAGVLEVGNNFQAIYGTRAEIIKTKMAEIRDGKVKVAIPASKAPVHHVEPVKPQADPVVTLAPVISVSGDDLTPRTSQNFVMPLAGEVLKLESVPDQVFSTKVMGDGFAVRPTSNVLVSPVDGKVTMLFKTKHACVITMKDGTEVLMHIGMDTVNLGGEGFEALVKVNDDVKMGTPLIKFDLEGIASQVPSMITPIVFTNLADLHKQVHVHCYHDNYNAGEFISVEIK